MKQRTPSASGTFASIARLLTLLAASSLTVLAGAVLAPALPKLLKEFSSAPAAEVQTRLLLTLPALAVALFAGLAGRLIDRWGARRVLLLALAVYGLGGSSGLWLDDLPALLAGRFILGVAVAGVMTAATTLLAQSGGESRRQRVLGIQSAFMGLGGLAFLTLGGALAESSWRGPFVVYLLAWLLFPIAWFCVADSGRALPESSRPEAPTGGTTKARWTLPILGALAMCLFYLVPTQVPFVLQRRFETSETMIGLYLGGMTLLSSLSSLAYAQLRKRSSPSGVLGVSFALLSLGLMLVGAAPLPLLAIAGLGLIGLGMGQLMPNLSTWTATLHGPQHRGRALGRLTAGIFLGQFLSPLVVIPLSALGLRTGTTLLTLAALGTLVAVSALLPPVSDRLFQFGSDA